MRDVVGTKKVCKTGTGMAVYLDTDWGFRPGDMVQIRIGLVKRGGRDDDTGTSD